MTKGCAYSGSLLIFVSDEQLRVLFHSEVLYTDGTFKMSPTLSEQLYVLHGLPNEQSTDVEESYTFIYKNQEKISILN